MLTQFSLYKDNLESLPDAKLLISTLNAHSYNVSKTDTLFHEALIKSDVLIPDGVSIVLSMRFLKGEKIKKIAGADLFFYEMNRLQQKGGSCFFLGSSTPTLEKIKARAAKDYPNVQVNSYSPPYKPEFSKEDNVAMLYEVNKCKPDVLFVGMTAPKQEKWAYQNKTDLNTKHICCIGAVFDFYAGTTKRAPQWMIKIGMEWLYRLLSEPKRLWKRYLIGNTKFVCAIIAEKFKKR